MESLRVDMEVRRREEMEREDMERDAVGEGEREGGGRETGRENERVHACFTAAAITGSSPVSRTLCTETG